MVSMATHSEFEKGGLPTKLLISQLLLILDYLTLYKLKLRHRPIIPLLHMQISIFINIYENIKNVVYEWGYTYKINNISAAFSHRLLKFILK